MTSDYLFLLAREIHFSFTMKKEFEVELCRILLAITRNYLKSKGARNPVHVWWGFGSGEGGY